MKIDNNDSFTIDATELEALSGPALKALSYATRDRQTPEEFLSGVLNAALASATAAFEDSQVMQLRTLGLAVVRADDETKAKVQSLVDQATALLGVDKTPVPAATFDPALSATVITDPQLKQV